jgi:hypothetical protein
VGYYTNFTLDWDGSASETKPCHHCGGTGKLIVADAVQEFIEHEPFCYGNIEPINANLEDSVKWYDHETDMKRLSERFPDVLFTLKGEGEEAGDVWVKYFKGGKMQTSKAEIKLDTFDPKKLK